MPDDIKLTLENEAPKMPTLTLEGVETPSLTLTPEEAPAPQKPKEDEISSLDESALTPEERQVVEDFAEKIDISNSTLVLQYGSRRRKRRGSLASLKIRATRSPP